MIVRMLNSNTHAGQGLREGGLKRCAEELDVDVVTVQEVQRPGARARLRMQFPVADWAIFGFRPPSIGPSSAGNHVLWRREKFKFLSGERELLSKQVWDGARRDKWHPSRRLAQVRLETRVSQGKLHNGAVGKWFAVGSDHLWTTKGHHWSRPFDHIVEGHRKQARAQARIAQNAIFHGFHVVHMGDENETMAPGDDHRSYMEDQYHWAGMRSARTPNAAKPSLDAAFVSPNVEVVSFDWIPERTLTTDHEGILLVVKI